MVCNPFFVLSFHSLDAILWCTKFLNFYAVQFFYFFSLAAYTFMHLRNHCLVQGHYDGWFYVSTWLGYSNQLFNQSLNWMFLLRYFIDVDTDTGNI